MSEWLRRLTRNQLGSARNFGISGYSVRNFEISEFQSFGIFGIFGFLDLRDLGIAEFSGLQNHTWAAEW
uniref:Uncharacterized protein n=1 Tax=Caenorhabditis brenneri TaxID=135651 RepID=B6VBQ9_CAEBE|nr:hypothetical protein Cbre_JD20.007 [Caenorhabditis brenneri]